MSHPAAVASFNELEITLPFSSPSKTKYFVLLLTCIKTVADTQSLRIYSKLLTM